MKSRTVVLWLAIVSALVGIIVNVLALLASKTINNLGNFVWIFFLFLASIAVSITLLSNIRQVIGIIIKVYQVILIYIKKKIPIENHKELTTIREVEFSWIGGIIALFIVVVLVFQLIDVNEVLFRFLSSWFR